VVIVCAPLLVVLPDEELLSFLQAVTKITPEIINAVEIFKMVV